jgi:outer membrane protein assembly factor BamC
MAIDRLEFSVEDRVRSDGIYFIKYRDPTIGKKKQGFFSNLFSFGDSSKKLQIYKVKLTSNEELTKVFVIDEQGKNNSPTTKSITSILFDQLK